jgi:Pyruvate/2-oxoacid:ferredoxin oxidoreductase delta subunit
MGRSVTERWYPVVDESRCTNCQHCLQFCISGVYDTDETGRVRVVVPDNCKPGCPACARICPNSAIMFPLCEDDQAIAGAPGKLVTPDPPARRMYYARTGARCPQCGQSGKAAGGNQSAEKCSECGRPVCPEATTPTEERSEVLAEIDSLVQELEDMSRGGQ